MKDRYAQILPESVKLRVVSKVASLCLLCRGGRRLCGKSVCPIDLKAKALVKNMNVIDKKEFVGSSPPSVFVGRFGYPKVFVGPMVPPMQGDTEIMDLPERWMGERVENNVNYRYSLIRGQAHREPTGACDERLCDRHRGPVSQVAFWLDHDR
jgi:hypothetical protein